MPTQIKVPDLGESITEATVLRWTKKVGDAIKTGDVLLELETDKVNLEVGAELSGVLTQIAQKDGADVKVGQVLGEIDENGVAAEPAEKKTAAKPAKAEKNEKAEKKPELEKNAQPAKAAEAKPEAAKSDGAIPEDVAAAAAPEAVAKPAERPAAPPRPSTPPELPMDAIPRVEMERPTAEIPKGPPVPPPNYSTERRGAVREERAKLSRRRRTIAERMVEAQSEAAILTTFNEIDMGAMMDMRAKLKDDFKKRNGVNLGITTFFIKAVVIALREFPDMNAEMRGSDIIYKRYYDIGAAIDTPEGLVVPVVREADRLTFAEIEQTMKYFVDRALRSELSLDDLRGGTFTITNGGVFGSLMSTPILNPPQVGILGLHRIEKRPVVKNDQIVIRPMMYAALSYDHRLIDGRTAVLFLARVKSLIEEPERLLVEG